MRVGHDSRAKTLNMADQVLDHLYGYTRRQGSVVQDRAFVAGMLQDWDDQVKELQQRIRGLEADLSDSRRQIKRLQYQLATQPLKRAWQYAKFVAGFNTWPS